MGRGIKDKSFIYKSSCISWFWTAQAKVWNMYASLWVVRKISLDIVQRPGRYSTKVCTKLIISILQAFLGIDHNHHGPKTGNIIDEASFVIEGHELFVNVDRNGGVALEAGVGQQEEFLNAHRNQQHIDREGGEALQDVGEPQEELEDVDLGLEHMNREGGEALEDVVEKLEELEDVTRDQESENEDIIDMFAKVNASETQSSKTSDNLLDEHMEQSDSELSDLNNSATISNSEQLSGSERKKR